MGRLNDPVIGSLNPGCDLVVLFFDDCLAEEGLRRNGNSLPRVRVSGYDMLLMRTILNSDSNSKRRASLLIWDVCFPAAAYFSSGKGLSGQFRPAKDVEKNGTAPSSPYYFGSRVGCTETLTYKSMAAARHSAIWSIKIPWATIHILCDLLESTSLIERSAPALHGEGKRVYHH